MAIFLGKLEGTCVIPVARFRGFPRVHNDLSCLKNNRIISTETQIHFHHLRRIRMRQSAKKEEVSASRLAAAAVSHSKIDPQPSESEMNSKKVVEKKMDPPSVNLRALEILKRCKRDDSKRGKGHKMITRTSQNQIDRNGAR